MLRTKTKMRIARALNYAIVGSRMLVGRNAFVRVRRQNVEWHLNLDEGIDLAIYLGRYQAIPQGVMDEWIHAGSLVVDIGANIGAISLPMLRQVGPQGRVIAIEPTEYAFRKLVTNAELNSDLVGQFIPIQAALTDGSITPPSTGFYSRWPLDGQTDRRHSGHLGQTEAADAARFLTLDALLSELRVGGRIHGPVAFIKLDVDGHELSVLRGGEGVLMTDRPALLVEIAPHVQDEVPGRFEELLQTIERYGYRLEDSVTGEILPRDVDALRRHIKHGACIDGIARPL